MNEFLTVEGTGGATTSNGLDGFIIRGTRSAEIETPSKTKATLKFSSEKGISPNLYFNFVKSKLGKNQKEDLEKKVKTLQMMIENSNDLGQQGLYEELVRTLAVTIREQEALVAGFTKFVLKEDIEKFMSKVQKSAAKISLTKLDEFGRPIPKKPAATIKTAKDANLFDEYWVLSADKGAGVKKETTAKKIARKDPIAFGKYSYEPGKFYFIADWTDEHCDITLDKLTSTLRENDRTYKPQKVEEISFDRACEIKREVMERHIRLENTKISTWKKELRDEIKSVHKTMKKRWWNPFSWGGKK